MVPLIGYETLSGTATLVLGIISGSGNPNWIVVNNTSARQIQLVPAPTLSWQPVPGGLELQWSTLGTIVQSNSASVGDPAFWYDILGTESVTNLSIIPNPSHPNSFYRLRSP